MPGLNMVNRLQWKVWPFFNLNL